MHFPPDIEREIAGHVEDPKDRLQTGVLSRRWNAYRSWCDEEFVERMHERPVTAADVLRLYTEKGNPRVMFLLTASTAARTSIDTEYSRRVYGVQYIRKLYILDFERETLTTAEGGVFVGSRSPDESPWFKRPEIKYYHPFDNLEELFKLAGISSPGVEYRFDPYTVRDVVNKRLSTCGIKDESLLRYFPTGFSDDYPLYVAGTGIISNSLGEEYIRPLGPPESALVDLLRHPDDDDDDDDEYESVMVM